MEKGKMIIPAGIKGLIFDLDGTILDSMPLHYKGYLHGLSQWNVHYPEEVFYTRGGIPTKTTFEMIAEENNIQNFDIEKALQLKREFVDTQLDKITLVTHVMDVIKEYHGKLPMAVGTGSNRNTVDHMFEMHGLGEYFEHVVTATEVSHHKPHPETFLKCAELIAIAPKDCIVFEDGKPGMVAAESAGMQVIDITKFA
ncbi:MAG: HAD-IA family hydrolase [Reichenbachiella sp.]